MVKLEVMRRVQFGVALFVLSSSSLLCSLGAQAEETNKKFDFGPPTSPVGSGYCRVTEETNYSKTLGYGWKGGNEELAMGSGDRREPDEVRRDFVYGSDPAVFAIDVPSGIYAVEIVLGDTIATRDNILIIAEDEHAKDLKVLKVGKIPPGNFEELSFLVAVDDGQLDLTFSDRGGEDDLWVVNSLVVRTATQEELGAYKAGEIQDDFESYPEGSDGSPVWEPRGRAKWLVKDGVYQVDASGKGCHGASWLETGRSNYSLSLKFMWGHLPNGSSINFFFRRQPDNSYYYFMLWAGQHVSFRRVDRGHLTVNTEICKCNARAAGTWYTVTIEVKGDTFSFYLGDKLVATYTDSTYPAGTEIGLGAYQCRVRFDDIKVTAPRVTEKKKPVE